VSSETFLGIWWNFLGTFSAHCMAYMGKGWKCISAPSGFRTYDPHVRRKAVRALDRRQLYSICQYFPLRWIHIVILHSSAHNVAGWGVSKADRLIFREIYKRYSLAEVSGLNINLDKHKFWITMKKELCKVNKIGLIRRFWTEKAIEW
jgi:hypothetical protein